MYKHYKDKGAHRLNKRMFTLFFSEKILIYTTH